MLVSREREERNYDISIALNRPELNICSEAWSSIIQMRGSGMLSFVSKVSPLRVKRKDRDPAVTATLLHPLNNTRHVKECSQLCPWNQQLLCYFRQLVLL